MPKFIISSSRTVYKQNMVDSIEEIPQRLRILYPNSMFIDKETGKYAYYTNIYGSMYPQSQIESLDIIRIQIANSFDDLDYSFLIIPNIDSGFLAPNGKWYPCDFTGHHMLARYYLKSDEESLVKHGWFRISNGEIKNIHYASKVSLETLEKYGATQAQIDWLYENGYVTSQRTEAFLQKVIKFAIQQTRKNVKNNPTWKPWELKDLEKQEKPIPYKDPNMKYPQTQPRTQTKAKKPLGIINNNPGNIEYGAKWEGLTGKNKQFAVFKSPLYGVRAMARTLRTYQRNYNLNTIRKILNRYAPSFENNTNAYINYVSKKLNISPDAPINLEDDNILAQLIRAIMENEVGINNAYSLQMIQQGIKLEKAG